MNFLHRLLVTFSLLFLAGCFQAGTVVRVNPDGSGTVEETFLLSRKMIASMEKMMEAFGGGDGAKAEVLEVSEPKLKERAGKLGEGVTFVSVRKVETADFSGNTTVYAFRDINKLTLQDTDPAGGGPAGVKPVSVPVSFRFSKTPQPILTIVQPRKEPSAGKAAVSEPGAPAVPQSPGSVGDPAQLMESLAGVRVSLAVEISGTVVSTDASHRDGNRIVLLDLDLDRLGKGALPPESLEKIGDVNDAKEIFSKIPGMKVELNDTVKVVFRK